MADKKIILKMALIRFIKLAIVVGAIVGIVYFFIYISETSKKKTSNKSSSNTTPNNNVSKAIEEFALTDDIKGQLDGLSPEDKNEALRRLGCQSAVNLNIEGYRSKRIGATFKVEKYKPLDGDAKYMIHAANKHVLSVDPVKGVLSLAVKDTKDPKQLFTRNEINVDGQTFYYFTQQMASGVNFALQYEHEGLSLRPLKAPEQPWEGQLFQLDTNLTDELLEATGLSIGYRLAPGITAQDLQNVGIAMINQGDSSTPDLTADTTQSASTDTSLGALTQSQLENALKAAMANIGAYNTTTAGAQPGTQNNPFANKPLRINLDLSGLGTDNSSSSTNPLASLVSGFADIPATKEGFINELPTNNSGTGQVRALIRAWEDAQTPDELKRDFGGFPTQAGTLGKALRGKMLSCPKIDRTQYYTERQLSQCAGCTPDAYLRGQLGGQVYI